MNPAEVAKRLLIGRRLRSTQLGETLLPKRIALPVFASDGSILPPKGTGDR